MLFPQRLHITPFQMRIGSSSGRSELLSRLGWQVFEAARSCWLAEAAPFWGMVLNLARTDLGCAEFALYTSTGAPETTTLEGLRM